MIAVAIGAGGVGHTLTAARIGIQAEQAWTPGETQQMKKRLHRIGQDRAVDYYVTVADGTIDEHLWAVVTAKQATLDAVLDGRSDSGAAADEKSVAADLTWRLTQQGLGSRASDTPGVARYPTPDGGPPSGNESGDDDSPGTDGVRVPAVPRPGRGSASPRAAGMAGSERALLTVSEHETATAAVVAWPAADHGSLGRAVRPVSHRVLVTGSRTWTDEQVIADALREHWHDGNALLVTGACPSGADAIAEQHLACPRRPGRTSPRRLAAPGGTRACAATPPWSPSAQTCAWRSSVTPAPARPMPPRLAEQAGIPVRRFETSTSHVAKPDTMARPCPAPGADASRGRVTSRCGHRFRPPGVRAAGRGHRPALARGARRPGQGPCLVPGHRPGRTSRTRTAAPATWSPTTWPNVAPPTFPCPAARAAPDGWRSGRSCEQSFTARLGPFTVVYGPCPRCGHPTAAGPGQPLPLCLDCASRSGDHGGSAAPPAHSGGSPGSTSSGDGTGQPGTPAPPSAGEDDDEASAQARITGQQLREAAHRYLDQGLLPVPAWAVRHNGECCCPRGADCGRPGKHPRSVHTGPGPHDYSWKPLACHTHAEIDQRFAPGGPYAAGNLMVAIPAGMMAIDIDDDDGGRAAVAGLAGELGELPPTLAHRTPHGEHLIYRTPPGWTGRAWVGKDPANPVPAGIDLRMPGQILMAAPSVVPGPDGPARYGPVTGGPVADLPAAYVTAWTPPRPQPRPARPPGADPARTAPTAPPSTCTTAMTRIAEDLASRQPGGRNAAAYAAGLKAGSLLGAARATPGAEHAAAWTDEEAEEALLDAAERNGYTGKDGQAEARRAIRSGLRNGLRTPRALPDFTTPSPAPERQHPPRRPAPSASARPPRSQAAAAGSRAGRWQDMVPDDIRREIEATDTAARNRRRAAVAAHQQALDRHDRSATAQTAADVERTRAAADAAHQAYTHDGRHITGRHDAAMLRWAAAIAAQREQAATQPGRRPGWQRPRTGEPRGRRRERGLPCRGPGPGPAAGRPGRRRGPVPRRAVAAAPAADSRPAADPQRPGRARRRRPPAGPQTTRGRPAARSPHARHLGRRPACTAPCPARPPSRQP